MDIEFSRRIEPVYDESKDEVIETLSRTKSGKQIKYGDLVPAIRQKDNSDKWIHEPAKASWSKMRQDEQVKWLEVWGFINEWNKLEEDKAEEVYSKEWGGYYSPEDLEYLNNYYSRISNEKDLSDMSSIDYARKMCQFSLEANKTFQEYRAGRATMKQVQDAQLLFENVSKTGNLTPKKKDDNTGANSFSELFAYIESTGKVRTEEIKYPPDDIDRMIEELRNIIISIEN